MTTITPEIRAGFDLVCRAAIPAGAEFRITVDAYGTLIRDANRSFLNDKRGHNARAAGQRIVPWQNRQQNQRQAALF